MKDYSQHVALAKQFFGKAFSETKIVITSGDALSPLDVFVWCDEIYIVRSGGEFTGQVLAVDGSVASGRWYWGYNGEDSIKIGVISQEKMNSF